MQQPWPPHSKKGFGDLLPGKNPPKFLLLKPNPLLVTMLAQIFLKKYSQTYNFIISMGYAGSEMKFCGSLFLTRSRTAKRCSCPTYTGLIQPV
jgi:hypothetical protein